MNVAYMQQLLKKNIPSDTLKTIDLFDHEEGLSQGHDTQAPAQFIAGWYNGITQEDIRGSIIDSHCWGIPPYDLTLTLYDAMNAYIAGDN